MRAFRTALRWLLFALPASLLRTLLLWRRSTRRTVVRFRLAGVVEEEAGAVRQWGGGGHGTTVVQLLADLRSVARDPSIEGIAVRVGQLQSGWAEVDEVRQAVRRLREKGRRTFVYLETPGHLEYFLATAFEHVVMPPMASLDVVGLRTEITFFKGTMDLLGVTACFEAAGEYKSFAEPFTRESMSDAFKESLEYVLGAVHGTFVDAVAEARGMTGEQVQSLLDRGPWLARDARDERLIDRTLYPDRWQRSIQKELGDLPAGAAEEDDDTISTSKDSPFPGRRPLRFRKARSYLRLWRWVGTLERWSSPVRRVAVVLATGTIGNGDEQETPPGEIAWRALSRTIRGLADDPGIGAVVLRIDSPGGSGAASDLLWRELRRLRKRKPLVASMGSTAASGGYYLAMAADSIVASPLTITGSIGVVGGKFDLSPLLEKAGLRREVLSYGEHTGLFSPTAGLTDSERQVLRRQLEAFYREFVGKAAECRGAEYDSLEEHARGRIWTGRQAEERGLVDEVGSLHDAIEEAARRAGLPSGWHTLIAHAPHPGFLRRLRRRLPISGRVRVTDLERAAAALAPGWRPGEDLVQARLPFELALK